MMELRDGRARTVYFVNAHTLNLAAADAAYRDVLNAADCVFGDGTGVRWAARLQGVRLQDNVNGTDLVPQLFRAAAGRGYRCFLLGADERTTPPGRRLRREALPGWTVAGHHHGYLADANSDREVLRRIAAARPDVLLVGMGNPLQEQWIHEHRDELEVPLVAGVGGLLNFWAGNVRRAPRLAAAAGCRMAVACSASSRTRPAAICWAIRCSWPASCGDWWRRKISVSGSCKPPAAAGHAAGRGERRAGGQARR